MIKLEFKNAVVSDSGYGITVNGKPLVDIISTALGVRIGNNSSYDLGIPSFECSCCDICVAITPKPNTSYIEKDNYVWNDVEEMEEAMREQFKEKNAEKDPKE